MYVVLRSGGIGSEDLTMGVEGGERRRRRWLKARWEVGWEVDVLDGAEEDLAKGMQIHKGDTGDRDRVSSRECCRQCTCDIM